MADTTSTGANLEAAFGGESMANRKYLFFADVAHTLGHNELSKLFRETAAQETEHAFAHFRLLHPELDIADPASLSEEQKQEILARCLELAIEGETYEYTTMYPGLPPKPAKTETRLQKRNLPSKPLNPKSMPASFAVRPATSDCSRRLSITTPIATPLLCKPCKAMEVLAWRQSRWLACGFARCAQ